MQPLIVSSNLKNKLNKFFVGPIYPALVGALILLSHIFKIEFYLNFVNIGLCILSLVICESLRPFIIVICTYIFQISEYTLKLGRSSPLYYLGGWRLAVAVILVVLVFFALVYFALKNLKLTKNSFKNLPFIPAAIILSAAFLINGAFSSSWSPASLAYGAVQVVCFFVLFYCFFLAFRGEDRAELCGYLAYIASIIALVIISEIAFVYLTNDAIIINGSIVKEEIRFGWGIWNNAGQQLAMTVPIIFLGVMKNRYPWYYFTVATLATLAAVMTLSRNALIFSVLAYGVSALIACFFGKQKKAFRFIVPIGIFLLLAAAFVMRERIFALLGDYFSRGLSDNGRFDLWREALDAFRSSPVLGKGFYGVYDRMPWTDDIFPEMAHNTVVELLGAMGVVGLLAYAYYRFETVRAFLKQPSLDKTMIGISILTILLGSLLDNFVFYFPPMIFYSIAAAIALGSDFPEPRIEGKPPLDQKVF